jgi:hypothetical protein
MSNGQAATLRYRISGKTLQLSDARQGVTIGIRELNAGKMVLHGSDRSIACER